MLINTRKLLRTTALAAVTALALSTGAAHSANADASLLAPGDSVVTGFSGVERSEHPTDDRFINIDGPSAQILSLRDANGVPLTALLNTVAKHKLTAGQIGQVFAIAMDDGQGQTVPYIYFGSTSYFGLEIVVPDQDGDGRPERVKIGTPGAEWMAGQFGANGNPGAIWRMNGKTGEVTLFASLPGNSGAGVGDIAFDHASRQLFVSDLDTGLIYRIAMDGTVIGSFDHGVDGRAAAGLAEIVDDGRIADIESSTFNSADPHTWGYTQKHRRISGLAIHGNRLYYAVADGPTVWSVGLAEDGGLADDAQLEFAVDDLPGDGPITDMLFDGQGRLYLAQRGEQETSDDYSSFAETDSSAVVRYHLVSTDGVSPPTWAKDGDGYAVGNGSERDNSNGGIALGFQYDADGALVPGTPDATLWATGDDLTDSANVDGVQAIDVSSETPGYVIDYDGRFETVETNGHLGDIEIWQPTVEPTSVANDTSTPETSAPLAPGTHSEAVGGPPPGIPTDYEIPKRPFKANLKLVKKAVTPTCQMVAAGYRCEYQIRIRNTGPDTYRGPIRVAEQLSNAAGATLGFSQSPNWTCWTVGAADYRCHRSNVVLPKGASIGLRVTAFVPFGFDRCRLTNVAKIIGAPGGSRWNTNPGDDMDSATVKIPKPDCETDKPDIPQVEVDPDPIPRNTNLKIEKRFSSVTIYSGAGTFDSKWFIKVTNTGPGTYRGDIRFEEHYPTGTNLLSRSPDLTCGTSQCVSDGPVTLPPSGSKTYEIRLTGSLRLAYHLNCRITNRVELVNTPGFSIMNTNSSDDRASATGSLPSSLCQVNDTGVTLDPSNPTADVPTPTSKTPRTPTCHAGWRTFQSKRAVPQNWRSYRAGRGTTAIWCAKKVEKPVDRCTRPARWNGKTCVCPGHYTWNGKKCVKRKVEQQKRCKKGYVGHPPNCQKASQQRHKRRLNSRRKRG